mmetsp:Transcript_37414/g.105604  ORF Transcript_37414/g.105604 Transcript_37414/m.105604 type:complete len:191 (-) Transcript_37414:13-585(-)
MMGTIAGLVRQRLGCPGAVQCTRALPLLVTGRQLGARQQHGGAPSSSDPFREQRGFMQTAEQLMQPAERPRKGWDWHLWHLLLALSPGIGIMIWGERESKRLDGNLNLRIVKDETGKASSGDEAQQATARILLRLEALEKRIEDLRPAPQEPREVSVSNLLAAVCCSGEPQNCAHNSSEDTHWCSSAKPF